jgi:FAD synthase
MVLTKTHSPLNSVQQHLLQMFTFNKREDGLKELKSVLFNYYRDKLNLQTRDFWEENQLDAAKMEEIMYGHNRISAK